MTAKEFDRKLSKRLLEKLEATRTAYVDDMSVVRETAKRLGKELEESGKDTFTIGDLRRINNDLFEEKTQGKNDDSV